MVIGEKFSLGDFDVWQIQELTEPCKSCILSCLIWMSLQHLQVEGLSMRHAFRVSRCCRLSWHWLRRWQNGTKKRKPFVGMTCQMDEESFFVEFSFLWNWLTDQLQYFQRQIVHWFLMWTLCKICSKENFLMKFLNSLSKLSEQLCINLTNVSFHLLLLRATF